MEILISIDGVLRNTIQKFDYHYKDAFLSSEFENENNFDYGIDGPVKNDGLGLYYRFQSVDELEYFLFIEYPIEIFGHAGISYSTTFTDLNKMIYDNPQHNFTIIGLNEFGKAKPATLFFLSKNGFLGNNIKFIKSSEIKDIWERYDLWITDSKQVIDECPNNKTAIKFNTSYNEYFTSSKEIGKLTEINEPWLNFSEKTTTLILTESSKNVEQVKQ